MISIIKALKIFMFNLLSYMIILIIGFFLVIIITFLSGDDLLNFGFYLRVIFFGILVFIFPLIPFTILWNYFFLKNKEPSFKKVRKIIVIIISTIVIVGFIINEFQITRNLSYGWQIISNLAAYIFLCFIYIFYFNLLYRWIRPLYRVD